jgi:hypothetical protein
LTHSASVGNRLPSQRAHAAGARRGLVPAHADHRVVFFAGRVAAVLPESRARHPRAVHEIEHRRPDRLVPESHLLVAAGRHELVVLPVRHRIAIEEEGIHVNQPARGSNGKPFLFILGALAAAGAGALLGRTVAVDGSQQDIALGDQRRGLLQGLDRSAEMFLAQVARDLRP